MDFIHIAVQTTLRSTGFATRRMLTHCKSVCWSALTKFSRGRCPTGCSLTLPRLELLWCSSARRQHQIPTGPVRVGDTSVQPVRTVRDLGVYIDADVTMSAHVTAVVKACFAALRQIRSRSVRRSLTRTTLLTLVYALVVTKVNYYSSILSGICYNGCSLSSTPPLVSCSLQGSRNT